MNSFISRLAATGEQLKLLLMNFAFVSFFVFQIYDRIKSYAYVFVQNDGQHFWQHAPNQGSNEQLSPPNFQKAGP